MNSVLDQLEASFSPRKVSIVEFAESPEFCGKRLYPRQRLLLKLMFLEDLTDYEEMILDEWISGGRNGEIIISPMIRERIKYLKENGYPHFREVVLVGGRRSSKGFVTGLAMAKLMYDTLQLQDPGTHFGIDPEKQIYFSCVAAALDQARKYQYADLSSTVASCAAFQNNLTKLYEKEFSVATDIDLRTMLSHKRHGRNIGRDLSKLRGVALAANASTIRGSATMAIVFDEMAHMEVGEETDASADKVYDAATPSLAQFGRDCMIFCNSSPYTKLGRFYERFELSLKIEHGEPASPLMFGLQFPSWALFERWQDDSAYKGPKKCITVSPDWDEEEKRTDGTNYHPFDDRQQIVQARIEEKENPDVYKVERRGRFAEVIDAYLNPEMVDRAFLGRPVRYDPDDEQWIFAPINTNWNVSTYQHSYKAHLDPSSTTAGFGFALGHTEEFTDLDGRPQIHVVFDIVKRWNPRSFPENVINWEVVLAEVVNCVNIFRPYEITFDQFNSAYPIQWLNKELRARNIGGVRVFEKTATAQSNWDRCEIFKTALYQGLVHIPSDITDCEYASNELKYLQQINTNGKFPRVDKQEIGPIQTKDIADCIMEVTNALIGNIIARQNREDLTTNLRLGAPGGYPIGGRGLPQTGGRDDFYAARHGEQKFYGPSGSRGKPSRANPARGLSRRQRPGSRRTGF